MAEDMSRWLRRVRPSTAADNDWNSSPQADSVLDGIHDSIAPKSSRTVVPRRMQARWVWTPIAAVACVAVVIVGAMAATAPDRGHRGGSLAIGTTQPPGPTHVLPTLRPEQMLLTSYSTCPGLLSSLRSATAKTAASGAIVGYRNYYVPTMGLAEKAADANGLAGLAPAPTSAPNSSTTNNQEVNVDEPDIEKLDGNRIVTITDGVLRVIDTTTRSVTGSLDLTMYNGGTGAQLFVQGDNALIMLAANDAQPMYYGPMVRYVSPAGSTMSTFLFVNLANQPTVTGSFRAAGSYLDARLVGSTVRLVVTSAPTIAWPMRSGTAKGYTAATKKAALNAPLSAWLPKYTITSGGATTTHTVDCNQVSHPASFSGTSMLTIYTLNMADLASDPNPVSVAADGDTVYGTTDSLYLASTSYGYCCPEPAATTQIHRFDISGTGAPTYLGSGTVSGNLLDRFSLSDSDGYLRVVTTNYSSSSNVLVLNADTLKKVGELDGLGGGERLYAVRFAGPTAYVVTFRNTDPLYVVDLSDPAHPKTAGTLELTGYSNYLQTAGVGRVLGFGQEANSQGMVAGMQISLFDVSNLSDPKRIGHVVLPGTQNENSTDPHSILFWPNTGLVVAPIQSWSGSESGKVLVCRVTATGMDRVGLVSNPSSSSVADDGQGIVRSFIVDGNLWTLSGGGVLVSNQSSLAHEAWIPFG